MRFVDFNRTHMEEAMKIAKVNYEEERRLFTDSCSWCDR